MKRILTTALVLLVALGLGIMALHSHVPGQDCNLCKYVSPSTTAVLAIGIASALILSSGRCLRPQARALPRRSFAYFNLRAPPIA